MTLPALRRFLLFTAIFGVVVGCLTLYAAEDSAYRAALDSIKAEQLQEVVVRLSDNDMEGREAGTRGGLAAARFLADRFGKLSLRGAGSDGSFLQPFGPNFRNVLAILDGGDPQRRDEVIVIGAHYDHIGYGGRLSLGPYGYVHPGADDNASGTAAVMELAEAFCQLPVHPKRSILFAAWDAEEKGLLGAKHWTKHPTIPLERVKAAVNLDMLGRLRDEHLTVFGSRSGYGWRRLLSQCNTEASLQLDFSWSLKPNADHYPFFENGIPVLMFHTGLHDQYHRPTDTATLVNSDGAARVTRLLFGLLYDLAEQSEVTPGFRAAARYENPDAERAAACQPTRPVERLGVVWIDDAATTGGVRVSGITAGSPADQAGLRPGDLIVNFAGSEIHADEDFFAAVAAAVNPVQLTVRRPGVEEPLEMEIKLHGTPLRLGVLWRVDDAEPGTIILTHIVPGTPASRAGLIAGDRIYQVNGQNFVDEAGFTELVKSLPWPLQLLIERDGRLRSVTLPHPQAEPVRRAA